MSQHPNTEHDEDFNRATWTGEAWLGYESMRAPRHDPPRNIMQGTFTTSGDRPRRAYGRTHN